jgi:hypothetical protein
MPPVPAPGPRGYHLVDHSRSYDKLIVVRTEANEELVKEMAGPHGRLDGSREVLISVVQHLNGSAEDKIEAVQWDFGYRYYGGGIGFTPRSLYLLALSKRKDGTYSVVGYLSSRLDKLPPSRGFQIRLVPTKELTDVLEKKAKAGADTRTKADASLLKQLMKDEAPKKKEGE